jgi:heat shock protein HtpX
VALQAVGLRTYIWNNNLKSLLLLAGFPVLLIAVAYAIVLMFESASASSLPEGFARAGAHLPAASLAALGISGVWFGVAYVGHQRIIDLATGSKDVSRLDRPDLYNLLENLAVSRGMAVPKLRLIETPALNAFASGLTEEKAVVTVTRGLVEALDQAELEAVLAHELSHVRHRDIRLLVIAAVFVGIISVVGEMVFRGMFRVSARRSTSRSRRGGGGNAGALVLVALAIIGVSYALAILVRFALSRRREFLADAGAVELTKNPDAMISALRKIEGRSHVERAPDEVREMFFDNRPSGFASLFATHPPIEARIEALVRYAGGREEAPA